MQTQQDHVNAAKFLADRMTCALVLGDPGSHEVPARRGRTGLLLGAVLALLIAVGIGIYGFIVPGGDTAWRQPGTILVEKETGTRYVFAQGALHATLNEASALLFAGPNAKFDVISEKSLAGLPHGVTIGIAGAPDPVPAAANLIGGPWLVCLSGRDGQHAPGMELDLRGDADTTAVLDDRYAVVTSGAGVEYVLWNGRKYRVSDPTVAVALGFPTAQAPTAPDTWLALLDDGPRLAAATVSGTGDPGPAVGGRHYPAGQLFTDRAANGTEQYFVLRADGLAPMSATEFALSSVRPGQPTPADLPVPVAASAPRSTDRSLLDRLPDLLAATPVSAAGRSVCVRQQPDGKLVTSSVVLTGDSVVGPSTGASTGLSVPPDRGMVVRPVPAAGQELAGAYLITDRGLRFPLTDSDSIKALGFGDVVPVPMAGQLIAQIPAGPALSRAASAVPQKG